MTKRTSLLALLLATSLAGAAACERTPQDMPADTPTGDEAGDAARDAGDAVTDAARETGDRAAAAAEAVDVKTALMSDDTVEADEINVDANHETMTIVLRGSVPTAAQREDAGRIATEQAPDYAIDNQLTVVPARD